MNKTLSLATLATLLVAGAAIPVASANTIVDDIVDTLACHYTGPQGHIAYVPYFAWVDGAYWIGSKYYVDYTVSYQDVERYNYCIAGIQVGAVNVGYGYSSSYHTCVNCVVIGVELA